MNINSLRYQAFRLRARSPAVVVELDGHLARLYGDLSVAARRLTSAGAAEPMTAPVRPAHVLVWEGCDALDLLSELPVLTRQATRHTAHRTEVCLVAQADRVAAVAVDLVAVLRGGGGFRSAAGPGAADLGVGLGVLTRLGPHETDEGRILVAETLSLAARLVLVLARFYSGRGRVRRAARVFLGRTAQCPARWIGGWAVRVVCLRLSIDLGHPWPTAAIADWVAVVLAVLVALVGQFVPSRLSQVVANLFSVVVGVALPHPVLVVLALADFLAGSRLSRSQGDARRRPGACARAAVTGVRRVRQPPREASGDHREHRPDQ
jgi:hypothetical protein